MNKCRQLCVGNAFPIHLGELELQAWEPMSMGAGPGDRRTPGEEQVEWPHPRGVAGGIEGWLCRHIPHISCPET